MRRAWQLFVLARRALFVSLLICLALTLLFISRNGEKPAPSPSQEREQVEQRRAEDERVQRTLEAEKQADPRVVLRLADAASATADTSLDGAGEQEAQSRGVFADQLRAAGIFVGEASQGTADARTLLAALEADRADAFWAQTDIPGSPTPDDLAAALGVTVDCAHLTEHWRALHAAANARGLALLRVETDAQVGAVPRVLVVRADTLVRLPKLAPLARLADAHSVLLLDTEGEATAKAAQRVLGDTTVPMTEVPRELRAAVKAGHLDAVAAALDARLEKVATTHGTADALSAAFVAADAGDFKTAQAQLARVERDLLSAEGRRTLDKAERQLDRRKPAAADALGELSEAADAARSTDPETGADAARALAWRALAADPHAVVAEVGCPTEADAAATEVTPEGP